MALGVSADFGTSHRLFYSEGATLANRLAASRSYKHPWSHNKQVAQHTQEEEESQASENCPQARWPPPS